ncbi:MAG TPA: hypothetical protein VHZ78_05180 [Rhizomicrobium sp.]|jgi:hypothetical protein|nr:hypothetical protein [Rhizomicrobium sp.]
MHIRHAATLLLAAALAGCATKTPPPLPAAPTQAEWAAIPAEDYTCKPSEFIDTDFATIAKAPAPYFEKCIRVRAFFDGRTLYRDATDRNTQRPDGHDFEGVVGVNAKEQKIVAGFPAHPQFVVVSGRLRSCAVRDDRYGALADRANAIAALSPHNGIVTTIFPTLSGFCHYSRGPVLFAVRIDVISTAMD